MTRQSALYHLGAVALAVAAIFSVGVMRPVEATPRTPLTSLSVSGRGWGHGRGMSQYGALGYASVNHWTASEILDHYYQNTSMGDVPLGATVDPDGVRVDLRFMHGDATTVAVGAGQLHIFEADGSTIRMVESGAVRLEVRGDGLVIESAPGCDGPWTSPETIEASSATVAASAAGSGTYDPAQKSNLLEVCGATQNAWYEGTIQAVNHGGQARTVNVVPIERYLRGVVPNEVIASWPEAVLEAQAVAARSYLMAGDTRQQPYADTCDTARCQVYDGVFSTRKSNTAATNPRTDEAILTTAGRVRLLSDGTVARTEFSSSSGGHTAGVTFPAVPDDGDSLAGNRFHTWTETIDTANLVAHYGHGQLVAIDVTRRNGIGAFGGRATEVKFTFEQKTVTVDGNTARVRLGLRSDWFAIQ